MPLFSIPSYPVCKKRGLMDILPSLPCSLSLGVRICRQEESDWNGEGLKVSFPVPCLCQGFQSGFSASLCATVSVWLQVTFMLASAYSKFCILFLFIMWI